MQNTALRISFYSPIFATFLCLVKYETPCRVFDILIEILDVFASLVIS